ncbi:MAG: hypothetical protein WC489_01765 [Patescibacteria group bacterium]
MHRITAVTKLLILAIVMLGLFIISFLPFLYTISRTSYTLYAQESSSSASSNTDLQNKIREYEKKLDELRQQKNTLASQIQEMDTQIYIKTLTIQQTEQKITATEREIDTLSSRIDSLDSSLTNLSKLLIERVVSGYKKRAVSFFDIFLNSENVSDLLNNFKYQKTTQENNQKLLIQVQEAKTNYEEQKIIRETKKQELDQLIVTLERQKIELNQNQAQKQKLLADTNNDETTYQSLLAQAQAQLKGFKTFVQSSGGSSIIGANQFGTGSDGSYYSQRDERWANQTIGYSSESILKVGCLLTSIAMFGKKNGDNVTPADIASNPSRFYMSTAYMKHPWPGIAGKSYVSIGSARSIIDNELNTGNYVIVGISYSSGCYYGGDHFVLLTKKDGDDYMMHDPIYGPDIKFGSHYSTICTAATFK